MAFWVKAFAWPSKSDSRAKVVALRAPLGRPFGLPDCPGRKGVNCFGTHNFIHGLLANERFLSFQPGGRRRPLLLIVPSLRVGPQEDRATPLCPVSGLALIAVLADAQRYHYQLRRQSLRAFSRQTTFGDLNQRYSPDHFAEVNPALSSSGTTSCRSASNFRGSGVSAEDSVSSCLPEDRNALKSSIGDADMGEIRFTFSNLASMLSELTYRKRRLP